MSSISMLGNGSVYGLSLYKLTVFNLVSLVTATHATHALSFTIIHCHTSQKKITAMAVAWPSDLVLFFSLTVPILLRVSTQPDRRRRSYGTEPSRSSDDDEVPLSASLELGHSATRTSDVGLTMAWPTKKAPPRPCRTFRHGTRGVWKLVS